MYQHRQPHRRAALGGRTGGPQQHYKIAYGDHAQAQGPPPAQADRPCPQKSKLVNDGGANQLSQQHEHQVCRNANAADTHIAAGHCDNANQAAAIQVPGSTSLGPSPPKGKGKQNSQAHQMDHHRGCPVTIDGGKLGIHQIHDGEQRSIYTAQDSVHMPSPLVDAPEALADDFTGIGNQQKASGVHRFDILA